MTQVRAIGGAIRYEFLMQIRRPSLWVGILILAPLVVAYMGAQFDFLSQRVPGGHYHTIDVLNGWSASVIGLLPIAAGLMLSDRFARDRRTRVDELMLTYPGADTARVLGKWLGATLAVLVPIFVVHEIGALYIMQRLQDVAALPLSLALFAAGLSVFFFVGAFSVVCPLIMPVAVYQFLFIGYWGWAVSLKAGGPIPTIRGTILSPAGDFIGLGLFPSWWNQFNEKTYGHVTALLGLGNIAALLAQALLGVLLGLLILRWQAQHR